MAQQQLQESRLENSLLRQKLDALARRYFGKKSEQLSGDQLELLMSGLDESQVEIPIPAQAAIAPSYGCSPAICPRASWEKPLATSYTKSE